MTYEEEQQVQRERHFYERRISDLEARIRQLTQYRLLARENGGAK